MTSDASDPCASERAIREQAEADVREIRLALAEFDLPPPVRPTLERMLEIASGHLVHATAMLDACEAAHPEED